MIIMSALQSHFLVGLFAACTLILSASYTLWMYKRVFFGPIANQQVAGFADMSYLELFNYTLLAAGVFILGLYPEPVINVLRVTIGHLLLQSLSPELALNVSDKLYL